MHPKGPAAGPGAGRKGRLPSRSSFVPTVAAAAVAISAVVTAVMVKRGEFQAKPEQAVLEPVPAPSRPAASQAPRAPSPPTGPASELVRAPPLVSVPWPPRVGASAGGVANSDPDCADCGVVATVVAVYGRDKSRPRGYQMHIRMDDGTMRTVEQPGALAAGTRVMVQGKTLRPVAP